MTAKKRGVKFKTLSSPAGSHIYLFILFWVYLLHMKEIVDSGIDCCCSKLRHLPPIIGKSANILANWQRSRKFLSKT